MPPFSLRSSATRPLLKHKLAAALREEILSGNLEPGVPIVETQWAPRLGVAQASIREAVNILSAQGFIAKEPGRSARVVQLTEADVAQIYQIRKVLESLAARQAAELGPNLNDLEQSLVEMREAAAQGNLRAVIEKDLSFHLLLAEKSGNRFLQQHLRQLLVPLFAFTLIRASKLPGAVAAWIESANEHRLIVEAIRSKDPVFAEQTAIHVLGGFARTANEVWARNDADSGESQCPR